MESQHQDLLHYLFVYSSFCLFVQIVNGVQFLNVTCLFLSSAYLASASSPSPVIVIVPLTSMNPSL